MTADIARQGRFEAWLVAPYERTAEFRGTALRTIAALTVFGLGWGVVSAGLGGLGARMDGGELREFELLNLAALTVTVVLMSVLVLRDVKRLDDWESAGRPVDDALALARLCSHAPAKWSTLTIGTYTLLSMLTWMPYAVSNVEPLRYALTWILAGVFASTLLAWPVIFFIGELALRPALATTAGAVPPGPVRVGLGQSLRTRVLVPVLPVMLSIGIMVSAIASLFSEPFQQLLVAIVVSTAFTLGYAALLYFVVTKAALRPVDDLIEGVERVAGGHLEHRVPITSSDEFADLARAFNTLSARMAAHDDDLRASRARIVAASDDSRRRVERDLHDGAQQYLVLLELKLGLANRFLTAEPEKAAAMLEEAHSDLGHALAELRDLAHGLYPAVLESDGLPAALKVAADRSTLPAVVEGDGVDRLSPEVEAAVYFCCLEAMQNAAKHAGHGATVSVRLAEDNGCLRFSVIDDGRGYDSTSTAPSGGLQNMADRIGALGGTLTVESRPGRGTSVSGTVPVDGS